MYDHCLLHFIKDYMDLIIYNYYLKAWVII